MENAKILYKMIAGFLIFFLVVAVTVPAVSSCEGSCCFEKQVVQQDACHESMLSFIDTIPVVGLSHATTANSFFQAGDNTFGIPDCHETKNHSCCDMDMPLAATKTHDFAINTSQAEYYQLIGVSASFSEVISGSDLCHLVGTGYLTAVRAAPVQLYLKNLSLLF